MPLVRAGRSALYDPHSWLVAYLVCLFSLGIGVTSVVVFLRPRPV